jgi:hypothetical protein
LSPAAWGSAGVSCKRRKCRGRGKGLLGSFTPTPHTSGEHPKEGASSFFYDRHTHCHARERIVADHGCVGGTAEGTVQGVALRLGILEGEPVRILRVGDAEKGEGAWAYKRTALGGAGCAGGRSTLRGNRKGRQQRRTRNAGCTGTGASVIARTHIREGALVAVPCAHLLAWHAAARDDIGIKAPDLPSDGAARCWEDCGGSLCLCGVEEQDGVAESGLFGGVGGGR